MKQKKHHHRGACYCGNIQFIFATELSNAELPKRECQCTFCIQHGRVSTSDPEGELRVTIKDPKNVNKYRFGHRTADFYVCRECGAIPVVTSEVDSSLVGLVDVRMIEGFFWSRAETSHSQLDGEKTNERLARRKRTWTGTVTFE